MIRLIQYGIGPIGAAIVALAKQKPNAAFIGAIDIDPNKVGKDLAHAIGLDETWGVVVSDNAAEVLARKADVVIHSTSSYLRDVVDQLIACVEAGSNVVSTCEELSYPLRKSPELSARIDAAAKANGVTVLGTGVNPGYVMDKLVLTASSVCQRVDAVRVLRVVDAAQRRLPLQKKVGAGLTVEEFHQEVAAGRIKHHGLPESAAMIAHGLNMPLDDISETIEPVIAERDVTTPYLHVAAGQVAGVKQICRATQGGEEKLTLELRMYVGADAPADTIWIKGVPDVHLTIPGGTHGDLATVAMAVNAIPLVQRAAPGLLTMIDIPIRYAGAF
ncbi:MAG: dihydrodipicolinate reductase [Acidobacteriota bacterium]|nr:dihydrodipicolinate reductase [Blastocatellia bacterium]MDW8238819.1 dihydrodipicolinate reductase [Acidobacteriota bacterium]